MTRCEYNRTECSPIQMTLGVVVRVRLKEEGTRKREAEEISGDAKRENFVQITIGITVRQATECGRCLRLGFDE
jgi:hypothetical protein